jgi:hypothetical protein
MIFKFVEQNIWSHQKEKGWNVDSDLLPEEDHKRGFADEGCWSHDDVSNLSSLKMFSNKKSWWLSDVNKSWEQNFLHSFILFFNTTQHQETQYRT